MDGVHHRGVEQHAAIRGGLPALGVRLAARRDGDLALATEADDLGDLLGRGAARDGAGPPVHRAAEIGTIEVADFVVEQDAVAQDTLELAQGVGDADLGIGTTMDSHRVLSLVWSELVGQRW